MQDADWNADGHADIVYSDTYQRTYLLINDGTSRERPQFKQQKYFDMEKRNHGMYAGGGDWNGDLVRDFLHMPFGGGQYKIFPGNALGGKGLRFLEGGLKACTNLRLQGDRTTRASTCAWAWDYSGTARRRGVIEYVGVHRNASEIGFYEVKGGQSKRVAVLAKFPGQMPQLTAGDLNADGRMDLLYSGGLWNSGKAHTKIWVMYGKVKNIPGKRKR